MTLIQLREALREVVKHPYDSEDAHLKADDLLLEYINNPEVTKIFKSGDFWYA